MSIDIATSDEWDRAARRARLALVNASAELTPRDVEALNRILSGTFGEVPFVTRAYVFLLHQMGKVRISAGPVVYPDWPAYHATARYQVERIEPPKTKPSIDWSVLKPEYKWLARDAVGVACIFKVRPDRDPSDWAKHYGLIEVNYLASYVPGDCDWKDSLVERPVNA